MSLPKRLYQSFRNVCATSLVRTREVTPETMKEFENAVNEALPQTEAETAQLEFFKGFFNGNPEASYAFIHKYDNMVNATILWTRGLYIARHFGLSRKIYMRWDAETKRYSVEAHTPKTVEATPVESA
jgi:hypothetical protein